MGIIVPAATPASIVQKLNQIMAKAVRTEPFRTSLNDRGFFPIGTTTDEWRAHIDVEIAKWTKVIAAGNVKPD
jgi:tripartite-type tricarboxylate transporter receptor subunit TctC